MIDLKIDLGIDTNNNHVIVDVAECPHILIGGTTGAGKSVLINSIIWQSKAPVWVIDKKGGVDYEAIKPFIMNKTVYSNDIDILSVLFHIKKEMYKRMELFKEKGCRNIWDYMSKYGEDIKPEIVIFDEFGEITTPTKKTLIEIVRLSRAAGFHFIIATQSPRATIIDGAIKANFPYRIALACSNSVESRLIIGQSGAEMLPNKKGYFYTWDGYSTDKKGKRILTLAQGYYLTDDYIREQLKGL